MKILKKITVGSINGVRGGFVARELFGINQDGSCANTRVTLMTVIGIADGFKEKTSENMGTSYGFTGQFKAINKDGEHCVGPVLYLPEPAQSLIKQSLEGGALSVDIGFVVDAIRNDTSIKGYDFELKPLEAPKSSSALEALEARMLGYETASEVEHHHEEPAPAKQAAKRK